MRYLPALIVDAVLVLVFAAIGRASHQEDPGGFLLTAWPFLIALVVGHALAALVGSGPRKPWSLLWGLIVWVVTVAGGMLLRMVSGDTAEVPFIIVATIVLGVFLVGWRALAALMRRRMQGQRADAVVAGTSQDAATAAPSNRARASDAHAHDEPAAGERDADGSAVADPAADDSAVADSAVADSTTDDSATDDSTTDEPATDDSTTGESTTDDSATGSEPTGR